MKYFDEQNAIKRFRECHFGISPSDYGYCFIDQYKDLYVYSKNQESIASFLKYEKTSQCFRVITPLFLLVLLLIVACFFITHSLASIISLWILACLGYVGISYIFKYSDKYMKDIINNTITVKTKEYGTEEQCKT